MAEDTLNRASLPQTISVNSEQNAKPKTSQDLKVPTHWTRKKNHVILKESRNVEEGTIMG